MNRLTAACLLALAPTVTWASIIPISLAPSGLGSFTWVYDFQLMTDQTAISGNAPASNPVPRINQGLGAFVTIYDFAGYVTGSCTGPGGWNCTVQNAGFTPDSVAPMDQLDLVNLTWTYVSGPSNSGSAAGVSLGRFGAASVYDTVTLTSYAARAVRNNGNSPGAYVDNAGFTQAPSAAIVRLVPEPSSLVLAGLGIGMLGWLRKGTAGR